MSNLKLFQRSINELRRGNEEIAHEMVKDIKCSYDFDDELEDMRKKGVF